MSKSVNADVNASTRKPASCSSLPRSASRSNSVRCLVPLEALRLEREPLVPDSRGRCGGAARRSRSGAARRASAGRTARSRRERSPRDQTRGPRLREAAVRARCASCAGCGRWPAVSRSTISARSSSRHDPPSDCVVGHPSELSDAEPGRQAVDRQGVAPADGIPAQRRDVHRLRVRRAVHACTRDDRTPGISRRDLEQCGMRQWQLPQPRRGLVRRVRTEAGRQHAGQDPLFVARPDRRVGETAPCDEDPSAPSSVPDDGFAPGFPFVVAS